jgi:hypothetical protein
MLDADCDEISARINALDAACAALRIPARQDNDPVAIFMPKRNIETWIAYLNGENVNESNAYPKLPRERDCINAVKTLKEMCDKRKLRAPFPESLHRACEEYAAKLRLEKSAAER